ncbi:hypothetical protein CY34DRAFT_813302 [Suillus luteus UH-Slu-Lm8-n1]|uniref:WD40 repeat-like protein n=1 Tax=Suillus luteus UH-Slu-Lm8-n1 TaxID=930992 RepID=A0A0D0A6S7_9AGAM|nr:hypothetical protein CY34DRAFT_813302 [Suillus luteus UH-Slu-Lm8-n1]
MAPTQKEAAMKLIMTPSITLKGHGNWIGCISYFPDGQRMISGSRDKTARQWDLKAGNLKEIEAARDVCDEVWAVAVSRDSRWIVTGGGDYERPELKASEVETGIVKKLQGHSEAINCIDISEDSTLLASGSFDKTARIWNLDTGKLVAGPFKSIDWVGAIRFSTDSKKLAVKSWAGKCLEVWDVQSQKLEERKGEYISDTGFSSAPIFWTNKNNNILASFNFNTEDDHAKTIYEFDALTLETVGTPFKGHTKHVSGLALSFDGVLLASASRDHTIKLWAFESRQLLVSFDVQHPITLILSPDSRTLAYSTYTGDDYKIYICNTPPNVLTRSSAIAHKKPARAFSDPLNPDGTRRSVAGCRKRPIHVIPAVHPPPTKDPQQPSFRPSKRFRLSPRMDTLWPASVNSLIS